MKETIWLIILPKEIALPQRETMANGPIQHQKDQKECVFFLLSKVNTGKYRPAVHSAKVMSSVSPGVFRIYTQQN